MSISFSNSFPSLVLAAQPSSKVLTFFPLHWCHKVSASPSASIVFNSGSFSLGLHPFCFHFFLQFQWDNSWGYNAYFYFLCSAGQINIVVQFPGRKFGGIFHRRRLCSFSYLDDILCALWCSLVPWFSYQEEKSCRLSLYRSFMGFMNGDKFEVLNVLFCPLSYVVYIPQVISSLNLSSLLLLLLFWN